MKKIITIVLSIAMILTSLALIACGNNEPATLKLGLGIVSTATATSATEETDGKGSATFTAAAVLVDAEGKIVKAFIDCADFALAYTAEGKAVTNDSFKTKAELGNDYGMKMYGAAINSGMGTCGLLGPIGMILGWYGGEYPATVGALDWVGLILVAFILPAAICWGLGALLRRIDWIRENDLKLS